MKDFFEEMFRYHNAINQKVMEAFMAEDNLSERTIPLISHMINAHMIWNSRILDTTEVGVHEVHTLEICKNLDNTNLRNTLTILKSHDLEEVFEYSNSKGDEFSNSIKEVLFQVANHHTHHRAQLMSDLRQNGSTPPRTDYLFHLRDNS